MNHENRQALYALLLPVFIIALICSLLIFVAERFTRERIALNKQQSIIHMMEALMPLAHDNELYEDKLAIPDLSTTAYRARQGEQPVGLVLMPIFANGYNGEIELAMGVSYDGVLSGVRIIKHRETEGLGGNIDQNKTDWVLNFNHRSLANTASRAWAVANDGGDFDQLSGATITPRAVINAVKDALTFYEIKRDDLYK